MLRASPGISSSSSSIPVTSFLSFRKCLLFDGSWHSPQSDSHSHYLLFHLSLVPSSLEGFWFIFLIFIYLATVVLVVACEQLVAECGI